MITNCYTGHRIIKTCSHRTGYVQSIDTEASDTQRCSWARAESARYGVDLGVRLTVHARIGDNRRDSPLATIHFNDPTRFDESAGIIRDAYDRTGTCRATSAYKSSAALIYKDNQSLESSPLRPQRF
jgi:hypothetical protein